MKAALLAGVCALLAGCIAVPIPHAVDKPVVFGERVADETLRSGVLVHQSSQEVVGRLGPPTYSLSNGRLFVYVWTLHTGTGTWMTVPVWLAGAYAMTERRAFIVAFDSDDRVFKTAVIPLSSNVWSGNESTSRAVTNWVTANMDGKVSQRREQAAEVARLIVYRTSDPPCSETRNGSDFWLYPYVPTVVLDNTPVGELGKGEYLEVNVEPGDRALTTAPVQEFNLFQARDVLAGMARVPATLKFRAAGAEVVYVEAFLCLQSAGVQMHLLPRTSDTGRRAVEKLQSVSP